MDTIPILTSMVSPLLAFTKHSLIIYILRSHKSTTSSSTKAANPFSRQMSHTEATTYDDLADGTDDGAVDGDTTVTGDRYGQEYDLRGVGSQFDGHGYGYGSGSGSGS